MSRIVPSPVAAPTDVMERRWPVLMIIRAAQLPDTCTVLCATDQSCAGTTFRSVRHFFELNSLRRTYIYDSLRRTYAQNNGIINVPS